MLYIYQTCAPIATNVTKNTQVIQTEKVSFADLPNTIFKDSNGDCWFFLGAVDDGFIPSNDFFTLSFSGDYFTNVSNIVYPNCTTCEITTVNNCVITYFSAIRCDNSQNIYVKVCDVGPQSSNLQLMPIVGQVYGITNPYGDDFCVTLSSIVYGIETEYEISTPAWQTYNCDSCPIYRKYIVDSCDGLITNVEVFDSTGSTIASVGTSVTLTNDNQCYVITSYEGIFCEYNYNNQTTPTIFETFNDCNQCLINYYNN